MTRTIISPLNPACIEQLRCGEQVLISGILYVARDAAHRRIAETLDRGQRLPFDISGQTLYYMGPSPAPPNRCIGSAGPTTSGRMDSCTPRLLEAGLRAMIGKGPRCRDVKQAMQRCRAVYCAAIGGAGALLARCILRCDIVAYPDLGAEALRRIEVELFPAVVVNDIYGGDLYETGRARYARTQIPLQ